jgi:hypothetical protein
MVTLRCNRNAPETNLVCGKTHSKWNALKCITMAQKQYPKRINTPITDTHLLPGLEPGAFFDFNPREPHWSVSAVAQAMFA